MEDASEEAALTEKKVAASKPLVGPAIPDHLIKPSADTNSSCSEIPSHSESSSPNADQTELSDDELIGPSLPTETKPLYTRDERADWERVRNGSARTETSDIPDSSSHEEWMTQLPDQDRKSRIFGYASMQKHVTQFAKRGVQERGDTSCWTSIAGKGAPVPRGKDPVSGLELAHKMVRERLEAEERQKQQSSCTNSSELRPSLFEQVYRGSLNKKIQGSSNEEAQSAHTPIREQENPRKRTEREDDLKRRDKKPKSGSSVYEEKKESKSSQDESPYVPFFDRERDLAYSSQASLQARRDFFRQASQLNSRFSKGSRDYSRDH
ncbi:GPALPP motifs-containing protein 1-like [Schistocerca gregaria]|uniref:GPALPP motifs-containing protein 1-like n=1 Tax=Schistocerca gregaria TaxID=7010 RepID=UPI00211DE7C2|nr:GPALPP motifs-containing protein 1-like [Schistocerca gregaria]